jgi:hypothetical protein
VPRIQRLNEDVESNAVAALHLSAKVGKPAAPFAMSYNPNVSDQKSVFSDTLSRRSVPMSAVGSLRLK